VVAVVVARFFDRIRRESEKTRADHCAIDAGGGAVQDVGLGYAGSTFKDASRPNRLRSC